MTKVKRGRGGDKRHLLEVMGLPLAFRIHCTAVGNRVSNGILQFYLPPNRGAISSAGAVSDERLIWPMA